MAVLHGRDVFVRLPTGGGKSLCMFQTHDPDTVGVIISPLIGLMDEQVKPLCFEFTHVHVISTHKFEGVQAVQNWSESRPNHVFQ